MQRKSDSELSSADIFAKELAALEQVNAAVDRAYAFEFPRDLIAIDDLRATFVNETSDKRAKTQTEEQKVRQQETRPVPRTEKIETVQTEIVAAIQNESEQKQVRIESRLKHDFYARKMDAIDWILENLPRDSK